MSIPQKGDIIINPNTSRPVKVGSKTWLNLVKTGIVSGHYTDPKELANIEPDENVEQKIKEVNKSLPRNIQAVRGRGIHKGKIVTRTKTPSAAEIARYNAQIGEASVPEDDEDTVFEKILEKMMTEDDMPKKKPPPKKIGRPARTRAPIQTDSETDYQYEETEESEY
jgi:hypothetical protein